jgi:hypothetical protein
MVVVAELLLMEVVVAEVLAAMVVREVMALLLIQTMVYIFQVLTVLMVVVEEAVLHIQLEPLVMVVVPEVRVNLIQLVVGGVELLYIATLILLLLELTVMPVLHQDLRVEMVVFLAEAAEVLLITVPE